MRSPFCLVFSQNSVPNDHYLVECKYSSTEWYREYNDGWIEQGGNAYTNGDQNNEVKFLKPFKKQIVTFIFSDDARWPNGHLYRAYSSSLTGFMMGTDAFNQEGRYQTIKYYYYATGY